MSKPHHRKTCKYVVKFGLAHEGRRLDYRSIFEPLGVRSLELAVRDDGVICIMLTTERCKTVEAVKITVSKYNESPTAELDGILDLLPFSDDCSDTILTFNRAALYQIHPFYDHIKFAREQSLLSGDDSNYCMQVYNQKKRASVKAPSVKKAAAKVQKKIEPKIKDGWSEFQHLLAKCKFEFSVSDL